MSNTVELSGLYPRSEILIDKTRQYERGRLTLDDVRIQTQNDTHQLVRLQEQIKVSTFSDGALYWQDQIRPLITCFDGVEAGKRYSRWFDTNTFYQKPLIKNKISFGKFESKFFIWSDLLPTNKNRKISIIGPYSFAQLSDNQSYRNSSDFIQDVANAENQLLKHLQSKGVSSIQLVEPCLVYQPYRKERPSVEEISIGLDAISLATHSIQAKTIVQTYFGDASPVIPALLELDIDGIGFDIFETEYSKFDLETDKILSLGIIDARDSNIEEPEWIASKTDEILEHVCSENVILTSNSDLKFVPWNIATDKVTSLAKAHAILEEN